MGSGGRRALTVWVGGENVEEKAREGKRGRVNAPRNDAQPCE